MFYVYKSVLFQIKSIVIAFIYNLISNTMEKAKRIKINFYMKKNMFNAIVKDLYNINLITNLNPFISILLFLPLSLCLSLSLSSSMCFLLCFFILFLSLRFFFNRFCLNQFTLPAMYNVFFCHIPCILHIAHSFYCIT